MYMHQNTPNYTSKTHFGLLGLPWRGLGGSKSNIAGAPFFFGQKYVVI